MIAAAMLAVALAQAPTAGEMACVLETSSEAHRDEIFAGIRRGRIGETEMDRIQAQAAVCAGRFGWNETRVTAMRMATLAGLARQRLTTLLAGRGIDTAIIDRWFERQNEDMRTTPAIDQARGERIARGLAEEGIPFERLNGDDGVVVGNYVGTLIIFERVRLGLPMD